MPAFIGLQRKERNSIKKIYFCFTDYGKAFDYVDHNKLWKILKQMGIPDHFTYLLRNLYAGQEVTVRTKHGTMGGFKIGKGYLLSTCLFNLHAEYIIVTCGQHVVTDLCDWGESLSLERMW